MINIYFKTIDNQKTKSTCVAEQIIGAITNGDFAIGDRLPPERIIANEMNVSRNSVRTALNALQLIGIIQSIAGSGTYVRKSVGKKLSMDQATNLIKRSEDLREVWEARKEIETSLSRLAIDRATTEEFNKARHALDEMRRANNVHDYEAYLEANKDFHLAIGIAADNFLLVNALSELLKITKNRLLGNENLHWEIENVDKSLEAHEDIFHAIAHRDKDAAARAIEAHLLEMASIFNLSNSDGKEVG